MCLASTLLMLFGCSSAPHSEQTSNLPPLPELNAADFGPTAKESIQQAYQQVKDDPRDSDKNGNLAMLLHAHRDEQAALAFYERAHSLEPGTFRWAYYLGVVHALQGEHDESVAALRTALRLDPHYLPARLRLAENFFLRQNNDESRKRYEEILREHPGNAEAHYGLGQVLASQGRSKAAVEHLRRAVEVAANFGAAHYALSLAYRDLGQSERSREHLTLYEKDKLGRPVTNDPLISEVNALNTGVNYHLTRGRELEEAGRLDEAILEQHKALEIDPTLEQPHINLMILYGKQGRFEEAGQHYRAALEINPNQAELHYNYGVLRFEHQDYQEAATAFRSALEINPNHARAHNNMGYIFGQQGQIDEAIGHFRKAIASRPRYRLAHFHLGRMLLAKGENQQAIAEFRQTLEPEDDQTPGFMYGLASAYARAGSRDEARRYLQGALERASQFGQVELAQMIERDLRKLTQAGEGR